MQPGTKVNVFNTISLVCGTWFLLTSWLWAWGMNIFVSFPVGIVGIFFWFLAKRIQPANTWNDAALVLHVFGLASAIITLFMFL